MRHVWRSLLYDDEWVWETEAQFAAKWWSEDPIREDLPLSADAAHDYLDEQIRSGSATAIDLVHGLVAAAATDDDLGTVGAGPLEDLVTHRRFQERWVAEVERRARQDPRFRLALSGVWLGPGVPQTVKDRLEPLGATDITKPRGRSDSKG